MRQTQHSIGTKPNSVITTLSILPAILTVFVMEAFNCHLRNTLRNILPKCVSVSEATHLAEHLRVLSTSRSAKNKRIYLWRASSTPRGTEHEPQMPDAAVHTLKVAG